MQESFGKRLWRIIYPMLTYMGVGYFVTMLSAMIIFMIVIAEDISIIADYDKLYELVMEYSNNYINEINMIILACSIPLLILYMHMDKKRKLKEGAEINNRKDKLYKLIAVCILGIAVSLAGTFMINMGGYEVTSVNNISKSMFSGKNVIEIISIGILYPITDELLFRGLIFKRINENSSFISSALITSLIYAFYCTTLVEGFYAFCMSFLLIYVYEHYNTILAPIIFSISACIITVLDMEYKVLDFCYATPQTLMISTVVLCFIAISVILYIENCVNREEQGA